MVNLYLPTTISFPIWSTSISQPLSHIWYGPPLSPIHYVLSDMALLYLLTTISYPIWSTIFLPTTISYLICFTFISQPLSHIRYGPPLCPNHYLRWPPLSHNHYLLSDMVHLYLPTTISYPIWSTFNSQALSAIRYGPPLSPNYYLLFDMVNLYLPTIISYLIWSTSVSHPIWSAFISQPLSPIWYGTPLSLNPYLILPSYNSNHYLLADMVHLYPPTTISYLIWSTSISQPLCPIRYGPPLSHMVPLYLSTTICYPIWSTFISQPLWHIWYGPPLSPNHYLLSDMVHLYLPTTISYLIWSTSISHSIRSPWSPNPYFLWPTSISQLQSPIRYGPPLSPNHYLLSDMVHLYLPTTISYPIWSPSISHPIWSTFISQHLTSMAHLYLPTTISYQIWFTFISQPLSPIWYGPPLSPNHYLLSDMVHL